MLKLAILAIIIAIAVTLGCMFLGTLLETTKLETTVALGNFLQSYGILIGILSGMWYAVAGYNKRPQ